VTRRYLLLHDLAREDVEVLNADPLQSRKGRQKNSFVLPDSNRFVGPTPALKRWAILDCHLQLGDPPLPANRNFTA
jgi:hypothetical protein